MNEIKRLRERYGLSRKQFCDVFCIPYRTLQAWELDQRKCPMYVYLMMEKLLELSQRLGGLDEFKKGYASNERQEN